MKFYKYRDAKNAWIVLDILFNQRLFLAPLESLNDPMELKLRESKLVLETLFGAQLHSSEPVDQGLIEVARMLELIGPADRFRGHGEFSLAIHTSPYSRVCSLTTNPQSALMWAHYANGHRGLCLEFELSAGLYHEVLNLADLQPVRYVDAISYDKAFSPEYLERVMDRLDRKASRGDGKLYFLYAKLRRLYTLKMQEWSYEKEWRIFGRAERQYYDFKKGEGLSRILLGPRVEKLHCDILRRIVPDKIPIVPTVVIDGVVRECGDE